MLLQYGSPKDAGMNPDKLQRAVSMTRGWVEEGLTPAVITQVARKGLVVLEDAHGAVSSQANASAAGVDTLYPMASISKVITATLVMTLVEEGRIGLNRPVQEYIPEFVGEDKDMVMVHNLLTHTSGIRNRDVWEQVKKKSETFVMPELDATQHPDVYRYLTLGYDTPLWKLPGEEMSYCGYGFELAAEIMRRVTGRSLADLASERIFEPLGMKDSYFIVPKSEYSRVLRFPADSYCGDWSSTPEAFAHPAAASGVYSTARDMTVFGQMFLNKGIYNGKRILSQATVETMTRNQIPGVKSYWGKTLFREADWGIGWMLSGDKKDESGTLRSRKTFYHTGAGCSMVLVDPVRDLVLVNFTVSMVRLPNGEPLRRFDFLTDVVMASIED